MMLAPAPTATETRVQPPSPSPVFGDRSQPALGNPPVRLLLEWLRSPSFFAGPSR